MSNFIEIVRCHQNCVELLKMLWDYQRIKAAVTDFTLQDAALDNLSKLSKTNDEVKKFYADYIRAQQQKTATAEKIKTFFSRPGTEQCIIKFVNNSTYLKSINYNLYTSVPPNNKQEHQDWQLAMLLSRESMLLPVNVANAVHTHIRLKPANN